MRGVVLDEVVLKMAPSDTVVTALEQLPKGDEFVHDGEPIELAEDVPFGHKVAVTTLEPGAEVVKYGEVIGRATERIAPGEWVHTHNCESTRGRGDTVQDGGSD